MSTLRSAFHALNVLAFAGICAVCAFDALNSSAHAAGSSLLFVSDKKANVIDLLSLPGLKLTGTITGLSEPHGLCSAPGGNIWATNYGSQTIFEYTHSGGPPIKTLTDTEGYPFACTFSQPYLFVANIINFSGPGENLKYFYAYPPPSYDLKQLYNVNGNAKSPSMNLYIVGRTEKKKFVLAVLPAGSTVIEQIPVKGGTINYPGMVQWDAPGHYLAVGDRQCGTPRTTCIYHISIGGSKKGWVGKILGKTTFETYNGHAICDMGQGVIGGPSGAKYFAGGDDEHDCGYAKSAVYRWAYPAGGMPTNYNNSALTRPFGTAISTK